MDRRGFLTSVSAGLVGATSGCVADGRVVMEKSENVMIDAQKGWWEELPDVEGNGALSFSIRANKRFDVYYFTTEEAFNSYKAYVYNDDSSAMPRGHEDISQAAVPKEGTDEYEVKVPSGDGRKSIDTKGSHYLVVDHSNYGDGIQVDEYGDPLEAFVDLKVIDEDSLI